MHRTVSGLNRRLIALLCAVAILAALSGGIACEQETSGDKLTVVTTIFPLADFVKNVAGDKVEVVTLLRSGDSPHTYEPSSRDMKAVARAKLLVINGAGLDFWAEKLKSAASDNLAVVDTSLVLEQEGLLLSGGEHEYDDESDDHSGVNPHFWLDPVLAQKQVESIASALVAVDPGNQDSYLDNADSYIGELKSLDEEIKNATQSFSSREFITFHASWTYFAKRYDLVEAAVIQEAPGKEPSVAYIKEVVDLAEALQVKAIFAEPQFNTQAAEAIADDSGAEVLLLDPLGGPSLEGRDSYIILMRYNVAQMEKAMG
ncbi:MAG: zinc ABC transporter substrate-binding protein [Dehalococcoidia bacterium]|nr:zinc ABC transporter substrate-binding protein [Dehalococcoidia bacterium]